ncbi:MAG: amidohydrolase family protein [Acidobacteriota bacterium]
MTRRTLLASAVPPALAQSPVPIIDTHIHLFDTARPQGIPWPPKDDAVRYKTALPPRYIALTRKLGIVGAIELECSPWLADNQWVLNVCAPAPIMVGMVGNIPPGDKNFRAELDKHAANPLYLGIRYGNIWGFDIGKELSKPEFVAGLKYLAERGLILDSANPNRKLLEDLRRASDLVPNLRIMIDHLPGMEALDKAAAVLTDLAARKQIYVKVSAVLKKRNGQTITDDAFYKPVLDEMWQRFGEDRVVYGSDWPNSDGLGTYEQVLTVVRNYVSKKSRAAQEKYFYRNSLAAYRWKPRTAEQRKLT